MPLARVNLITFCLTGLAGYYFFGPVMAVGLGCLAVSIVLFWHLLSTSMVIRALKAVRMTDASAETTVHRLYLSDAQALRAAANIPVTQFYMIDAHVPLAFSMGSANGSNQLMITSGLFKTLTRLEISAVIAHELGHIKAGDSSLNAMRLSLSLMISRVRLRPVLRFLGRFGPGTTLLANVLSRSDYRADAFSARLCKDAKLLASALKKLERGVRAVQWSALDKLPSLAGVTVIDPFAAYESYDHPEQSEAAFRVAELYRLDLPEAA